MGWTTVVQLGIETGIISSSPRE